MDKNKAPELTDTQIMLILKNALEFNASIVQYSSFIYGQDLRPRARREALSEFKRMAREYSERVEKVLEERNE